MAFLYKSLNSLYSLIIVIIILQDFVLDIANVSKDIFILFGLRIDLKRQILNVILILFNCFRQIFFHLNSPLWVFFLINFNLFINNITIFIEFFFKLIKILLQNREFSSMFSLFLKRILDVGIKLWNNGINAIKNYFGYIVPFILINFENSVWVLLNFNHFFYGKSTEKLVIFSLWARTRFLFI